jgi:putative glutamine amidotransferase
MTELPRIAVLLDENTSGDGSRYEASKNYFRAVHGAGGAPFGIPYFLDMVDDVIAGFDGLLCVGGRFAYPADWYIAGRASLYPSSERLPVERALMEGFLARDKPVLGICAGMQMLGCLHGCHLAPEIGLIEPQALPHDQRGFLHEVSIVPETRLAALLGTTTMRVNTFHREALADATGEAKIAAFAEDGIIEAIELPSRRFAFGLQWHQEAFAGTDHPGNAVFAAFVAAAAT